MENNEMGPVGPGRFPVDAPPNPQWQGAPPNPQWQGAPPNPQWQGFPPAQPGYPVASQPPHPIPDPNPPRGENAVSDQLWKQISASDPAVKGFRSAYPVGPQSTFPPAYGAIANQPTAQSDTPLMGQQPQQPGPTGLQYLSMVDQLLVSQQIEIMELLTGIEAENKYRILNTLGQDVYFATEKSGIWGRNCCGGLRAFNMKIFDHTDTEVIHLYRPQACQGCCCPCCLQYMEVSAPPGNIIGTIKQNWSIWNPSFTVKNANGDTVFRIKGPCWTCSCGSDVNFSIRTADGYVEVGKITKKWSQWIREAGTDADNFMIKFPENADVNLKALLLGALFLVDFMYFENPPAKGRR